MRASGCLLDGIAGVGPEHDGPGLGLERVRHPEQAGKRAMSKRTTDLALTASLILLICVGHLACNGQNAMGSMAMGSRPQWTCP
jgi:hypothetical protein